MSIGYDLHSSFDIEKHKATYFNYLEVIIKPDGVIEYAVPSHVAKLEKLLCDKLNVSKNDLLNKVPPEYLFDYSKWLCNQTGCILMWDYTCIGPESGKVTPEQMKSISELEKAGLYHPENRYVYCNIEGKRSDLIETV